MQLNFLGGSEKNHENTVDWWSSCLYPKSVNPRWQSRALMMPHWALFQPNLIVLCWILLHHIWKVTGSNLSVWRQANLTGHYHCFLQQLRQIYNHFFSCHVIKTLTEWSHYMEQAERTNYTPQHTTSARFSQLSLSFK
jgi:hypothetical protein